MTKTELITKILKLKNQPDDIEYFKSLYGLKIDRLQRIYEAEYMKALKEGRKLKDED